MSFSPNRWVRVSLIAASALILAAIACNTPAGTSPTATAPVVVDQVPAPTTDPNQPTPADGLPPAPTPTTADVAQPTTDPAAQPSATPAPPQAPPANADYNGISFYRSNDLASEWTVEITPVGDPSAGPFASPSHYSFQLTGYPATVNGSRAIINVFPLDNITEDYVDHNAALASLREFLKTKPTNLTRGNNGPPHAEVLTAPQLYLGQLQYIQFQNGEGVRYLATFKHDVSPVAGSDLSYIFQGFTYDGQYYISMIMTVQHPIIPAEYPLDSTEAYDEFVNQYEPYIQGVFDTLNGADASSFTPSLALLDELVNSLNVAPAP